MTPHVDRARERLEKAVARLDRVVQSIPESENTSQTGPEAGEVAALKAENARLQDANRLVVGRLDKTIDNLKAVLES